MPELNGSAPRPAERTCGGWIGTQPSGTEVILATSHLAAAPLHFARIRAREVRLIQLSVARCSVTSGTSAMTLQLTPPLLGSLARAALDNASDLLADASVLLQAGRYPRAFALSVLAAEEFGKHMQCVSACALDLEDPGSPILGSKGF